MLALLEPFSNSNGIAQVQTAKYEAGDVKRAHQLIADRCFSRLIDWKKTWNTSLWASLIQKNFGTVLYPAQFF